MRIISTIDNGSTVARSRTFLNGVFGWMSLGFSLTAAISYLFYSSSALMQLLINESGVTTPGYVAMFSPIVFVLLMSFGVRRLSYTSLVVCFLLYASIMGVCLSFIFLAYAAESIYKTFLIAALMFGVMSVMGYTTKTDLTKLGNVLLMGLIGILIASMLNLFMKSDSFSFAVAFISVIVFCGLTAWDLQKLKNMPYDTTLDSESGAKLGVLGALTLYLDFINLFLSLLRLFGNRRKD